MRSPGKVLGPRANRTIAAIVEATRQVFLTRGYSGTTIDEIAKVAEVSRASFYTYFPSKRDALLALGDETGHKAAEVVAELGRIELPWTVDDLATWVHSYFELLDDHGSFAFAWTQAAHEDEELLRFGAHGHLELSRRLGVALGRLSGTAPKDPIAAGLVVHSALERAWSYRQLYAELADGDAIERNIVDMVVALVRCPPATVS
jgi:TetR/AcrR family transcriptional regulator